MKRFVFILVSIAVFAAITYCVNYEWPFTLNKLDVYFAGLGFLALVATLALQQKAIQIQHDQFKKELDSQKEALELQQRQINHQLQESQFDRILDLIEEPVKRYWEIQLNNKTVQRDTMTLLASRHLTGLALGIEFNRKYDSLSDRKHILEHVYDPFFVKWADGNQEVLDEKRKEYLATVKEYYGVKRAG